MAVEYSPKMIFRLLRGPLLNEYFAARGQADQLSIEDNDRFDVDRLYQQWENIPAEDRDRMEAELRAVHELAISDTDLSTVFQEAEFQGCADELRQAFDALKDLHAKMLWILLHYPTVFEVASTFKRTDNLSLRYWRKRSGCPKQEPLTSTEARQSLATAIRDYYMNREGRGRYCHIDVYKRGDEIYYYSFLDDYPRLGGIFDAQGKYRHQALKDSFEVIFRYNPIEGELEVFAQAPKAVAEALQKLFALVCLESDLPTQQQVVIYELNPLKRRNFSFPTDPEDRIRLVRVKSLTLSILGAPSRRIILVEGDEHIPEGIYDALDQITSDGSPGRPSLHWSLLNVVRAELQMIFASKSGKDKKLLVRIAFPDACNLRETDEERIARKYLKRWGLDVSSGAATDIPEPTTVSR